MMLETSLIIAAEDGMLQDLRAQLQRGANINATDKEGCTALITASYKGHLEIVQELLAHDTVQVNIKDNDGSTALMMACYMGHALVVEQLVKHKMVQVNLQDKKGNTALHEACSEGYFDAVFQLLQHDMVDVNLKNYNGKTASTLATNNSILEIVLCLEEYAANAARRNANFPSRMQEAPRLDALLINAARDGRLQDVCDLLQKGADINAIDDEGYTTLSMASYKGHPEIVRELLRHAEIQVNVQNSKGRTALIEASALGYSDVVTQLLKHHKVDVNLRDHEGHTAHHEASSNGYQDIASQLLQHDKEDLNLQHGNGDATASTVATYNNRTEVVVSCPAGPAPTSTRFKVNEQEQSRNLGSVRIQDAATLDKSLISAARDGILQEVCALLKVGANINATDEFGQTALVFASHKGHGHIICELLKHPQLEVNLQNHYGCTALMMASSEGHTKIVEHLLNHDDVDVNLQDKGGSTSLMMASCNRHSDVVDELLKHNKEAVNFQDNHGTTALMMASLKGHCDIVKQLLKVDDINLNLEDNDGDTALLEASSNGHSDIVVELLKLCDRVDVNHQNKDGKSALTLATDKGHLGVVRCLEEHAQNQTLMNVARASLSSVMESSAADPVEISMEYIQQCTTNTLVGTGAYGKVYLGKDSELSKPFVVKTILFTHSDQTDVDKRRKSIQREISALKRFRHPNIITLYGYAFNSNHSQQYLVYEYAAHGSLDGFFRDDAHRAQLTADIRLSIMFELTRAVHFLHSGGCNGYRLFHRDIKSANICLAEDYTVRLIDCGLSELVPINSSAPTTSTVMNCFSTNAALFGTPGYICPEFALNVSGGRSYSYTEACDVYSVGVVLAELIVGHLIGDGQELSMDGTEHFDVYYNCIADKKGKDIPRGWERLKEHADPSILWTPESLDLICNAAIRCMNRTTDGRMTTKELLSTLRQAIHLHNSDTKLCHPVKPESELALCNVCFLNMSSMRCDEGHVLCMPCIEIKIQRGLSGISQVVCPFDGCSSSPFPDEYLYGRMSLDVYNLYIERKTINFLFGNLESKIDKFSDQFSGLTASVDDMKRDVKRNTELLELQLTKIDKLAQGLDRNMSLLSWLADIHSKECPHLVWITPVAVTSRNPKEWIKMVTHQRYKVVFICEHSFQPGHDPIEIKMPRHWIVVMAPWLKLCLRTLQLCNMCRDLPFPLPGLEFKHQCKAMHAFLNVVAEAGTIACDRILDQSKIPTEMGQQVRQCASPAFKLIAEKANEESRAIMWRSKMVAVPVDNADRRLIWVKKEHQNEYINSARSA